jgi:hypothetical protein
MNSFTPALSPVTERKVNAAFRSSPFWAAFEAAIARKDFSSSRRIEREFIRQLRLTRFSLLEGK